MKLPTRRSATHYMEVAPWLREVALQAWHAVPGYFVGPLAAASAFTFVCGCGHSGTTLVAARLGNHPQAFLIARETEVFLHGNGVGIGKRVAAEWDYFAQQAGKAHIIEKTPRHVHYLAAVWRILPAARVVMTTRNPLDNVASLYARFGDLDGAIGRWNADNRALLGHSADSRAFCLRYEDLVTDAESALWVLSKFCGLPWDSALLVPGSSGYDQVTQRGNMADRAGQVRQPITDNNERWRQRLTLRQAHRVVHRTRRIAQRLGYGPAMERAIGSSAEF